MTHFYGYKRDRFDHRDLKLEFDDVANTLPTSVDLSTNINWIYNQGNENSCVAQSTSSLVRFIRKEWGYPEIDPSRNFIYWCGRRIEDSDNRDAGMQLRDAFVAMSANGYCSETMWGYQPSTLYATPPVAAFTAASKNLIAEYRSISQDHVALRTCLAANTPFVFGIEVFTSFESDAVYNNGIVPMPTQSDKVLGGHVIFCVGYDDNKQYYKFMNSWGDGWGDKGYGYLPYAFVEDNDLADDFWTITSLKTII